jgi:hypothetical protein
MGQLFFQAPLERCRVSSPFPCRSGEPLSLKCNASDCYDIPKIGESLIRTQCIAIKSGDLLQRRFKLSGLSVCDMRSVRPRHSAHALSSQTITGAAGTQGRVCVRRRVATKPITRFPSTLNDKGRQLGAAYSLLFSSGLSCCCCCAVCCASKPLVPGEVARN